MPNTHLEYEALFNNASIGIITVNGKGEIVLINDFALKQFGYDSAKELLGSKIEVLIPSRYKERHTSHRSDYIGHNPHSRPMGLGLDLYGKKKGGIEFPVEVSLSTYKIGEETYALAFVSDISVRKESENALVQLNAQLEQKVEERTQSLADALAKEKELNELKSRFVSMASHEFRTPLSTILSSLYLIAKYDTTEDQPKREKHITRSIASVNMLTDILNDFLSVGKIEEGKIQVRLSNFDIKSSINGTINELKDIAKPGQSIEYEHYGDTEVILDISLFKHIVMNLVSNAIKFSPENSVIRVTSSNNNGELSLIVQDSGIGIPEEDQQHLFERFFRASNVTSIQGTGLGLHIVSKYVDLMNGTIACSSQYGKGTAFTINFKFSNTTPDEESTTH